MKEITELHRLIDQLNARIAEESAKNGRPVTCKGKGCFSCCYEPVYASDSEVTHMLEGLSEDRKTLIAGRTEAALDKFKAAGLLDANMPPVMKWKAVGVMCPFLENGECSAYDRRPIGCRSHMAVGPAEWCETNREHQKYPMSNEVSAIQGSMILAAHMQIGGPIIHYPETASAQVIQLERTDDAKRTQ